MLKSIVASTSMGVLLGIWIALVNGSVEVFENYVGGAWRYQVEFNSVAEILVGAVIGVLAGANIRLALASERADGFVVGTLVGAVIGVLLALAQIALVALAALLQVYDVEYGLLLPRFSGILAVAVAIGAAGGLAVGKPQLAAPIPGAVVGALAAVALVLPAAINTALTISVSNWSMSVGGAFVSTYLIPHLPVLLAGAGSGAIIGAARKRQSESAESGLIACGVILGTVVAVTASSLSFHYVVLGLASPDSSFSLAIYAFRILVGLLGGVAVGMGVVFAGRRVVSTRGVDADMICPD